MVAIASFVPPVVRFWWERVPKAVDRDDIVLARKGASAWLCSFFFFSVDIL